EAIAEFIRTMENSVGGIEQVQYVGCGRSAEEQGRARAGIDDPMPRIERDREQGAGLPFEDVTLLVTFKPDLGRTAALNDVVDFLIQVLFGIQRAGARDLDQIAAPFSF